MKILTIVGARPNFVKAAMVSRALKKYRFIRELILHTGQHHDYKMSQVFFEQLQIPKPYKNLNAHSRSYQGKTAQGAHTAEMVTGIEIECFKLKPDLVLIYGDTNSTLAGALAASKLHIPVAHVEAGLRSFNPRMPEEVNRVLSDRVSTLLFSPTQTGVKNLKNEGIRKGVHQVGDVMIDAIHFFRAKVNPAKRNSNPYFALTLHRQENTDNLGRLHSIFEGLSHSPYPLIWPVHPRTQSRLKNKRIRVPGTIKMIEPLSYLEMISLQSGAEAVWTDSGGVQKEAVVLGKGCYTLRDETEWVETVESGWNRLVGANARKIRNAMNDRQWQKRRKPFPVKRYYGDGFAAEKIAKLILKLRP